MSRDKQNERVIYNYQKRLYKVWINIKQRCYNPKHNSYKNYGGRGITICDEWRTNYCAFEKWALENGYDENAPKWECTIDRIENDKGYFPENCRWVSIGKNANNKRTCLMYTHNGKTQSLADWAREFGMDYNALFARMRRNGFDLSKQSFREKTVAGI